MARLIDADALMKKYGLDNATKYGNKTAEEQAFSYDTMFMYEIADMIEDAPTIEAEPVKQEWISVEDRLPPDGNKPYLTCRKTVKGRTVIESRYLHTSYESPCVAYWEGKKNGEVTHWMPLPEPPKEGE